MENFEIFWMDNQELYKAQALKDFDKLNKGQYVASVSIYTDDDFALDIGEAFETYGKSKKSLVKNLIDKLQFAELTYCKTWAVTDKNGVQKKGDYSDNWTSIRDEAIKELKKGSYHISYGGNQNINIKISPNVVEILKIKTNKHKP